MKFNFKKFGEAVKFKRTAGITGHDKPYTLRDLSSITGVDYAAISRVENGKTIILDHVLGLSLWAGLNIYDFIEK
jgi:transcriptional regulator with XRE-family HTH domain